MSHVDYRQHIHGLIHGAEQALRAGGSGSARTHLQTQRNAADDMYALSALAAADENAAAMSHSEQSRQLRLCMKEIAALRTELTAEREGRNALVQLFGRRLKEEIAVDLHRVQHEVHRDVRELEASLTQKLQEADTAKQLDKRRLEDALRLVKAQERQRFDAGEQLRDALDDMRVRVDAAVSLCSATRAEATQLAEKERAQLQHRLDMELLRYTDLTRQQQKAMTEVKQSVAVEVAGVAQQVRGLVDAAWAERLKGTTRQVNDALAEFKEVQERHTKVVLDLSSRVDSYTKEGKRELQAATADLRERIGTLESAQPLLAARVDRFERKADAVMDSNSKMAAQVDVLRETADKAAAQAQRSMDRAERLEGTITDRDGRLLALESQGAALASVERLRVDAEATKRAIARVENQVAGVKETADRDERLVEAMQRSVEASLERGDATEKKAHRVVARVEAAEQRLLGFLDRMIALESAAEQLSGSAERGEEAREGLALRVEAVEQRHRGSADRHDAALREVREKLVALEGRVETALDTSRSTESALQSALHSGADPRKEQERWEKKLARVEVSVANSLDNVREVREALGEQEQEVASSKRQLAQLRAHVDQHEQQLEERVADAAAAAAAVQERSTRADRRAAQLVEATERRLEAQFDDLARRVEATAAAVAKQQHEGIRALASGAHNSSGGLPQGDVVMLDVAAVRRKAEALEARIRHVESALASLETDAARRHDIATLRAALAGVAAAAEAPTQRTDPASEAARVAGVSAPLLSSATTAQRHDPLPSVRAAESELRPTSLSVDALDTDVIEIIGDDDVGQTKAAGGAQARSPPAAAAAAVATTEAIPRDAKSAATTGSSPVSSMHGVKPSEVDFDDDSDDDGSGVRGREEAACVVQEREQSVALSPRATAPKQSSVTPAGLPPLHSDTPPSTTTALSPKLWQNTRRTPYSDTSESDRERSAENTLAAGGSGSGGGGAAASGVVIGASPEMRNSFGSMVESEDVLTPKAVSQPLVQQPRRAHLSNPFDSSAATSGAEDITPSAPVAAAAAAATAREARPFTAAATATDSDADSTPPRFGAAAGRAAGATTATASSDEDFQLAAGSPISAAIEGRPRRKYITDDSSSSVPDAGAGSGVVAAAARSSEQPKKYHHHQPPQQKPRSYFDDDEDHDDDDDDDESSGSDHAVHAAAVAAGGGGGGSGSHRSAAAATTMAAAASPSTGSKGSSKRSAATSRRTADVSLSLETDTLGGRRSDARSQPGRGSSAFDDDIIDAEDSLDDDQLATMLGMLGPGSKAKK